MKKALHRRQIAVVVAFCLVTAGVAAQEARSDAEQWKSIYKDVRVQFVRLKYGDQEWDDGMGTNENADVNFLREFRKATDAKDVDQAGRAVTTRRLGLYPKGTAPPFIYMTGSGGAGADAAGGARIDHRALRRYINDGGMIFADCGSQTWDRHFRSFAHRAFPDKKLVALAMDDPVLCEPFAFPDGPPVMWPHGGTQVLGVRSEGRWAVLYYPGDLNDAWKDGNAGADKAAEAFRLGINFVHYAWTQSLAKIPPERRKKLAAPSKGKVAVRLPTALTMRSILATDDALSGRLELSITRHGKRYTYLVFEKGQMGSGWQKSVKQVLGTGPEIISLVSSEEMAVSPLDDFELVLTTSAKLPVIGPMAQGYIPPGTYRSSGVFSQVVRGRAIIRWDAEWDYRVTKFEGWAGKTPPKLQPLYKSRADTNTTARASHTVQHGETLATIAERYYGMEKRDKGIKAIMKANPHIGQGSGIQSTLVLTIPDLE